MANDHEFRRAIEEIKLRAPLESIVSETVDLKQKGNQLWGCCPFHEERTPSFKVDPQTDIWYCFGACRKGGDVIKFVQERGNMTFMDALSLLAAQTGVELPRKAPRRSRDNDPGLAALAFAVDFFQAELKRPEGRDARDYIESRGFGQSAIEAFGLGWAPRASARFMEAARREKISDRALIDAGLARQSDRGPGDVYAFFRGRLMIPIRDERGTTIAFGGRVVEDEDGPKYVNTSETRYFHKGKVIYALDRALESVRRGGHLVLVEGYTDVIAAHVAGMPNVGAVLGTATTEMHAGLVRRAGTRRVSLVFDGDEAGRRAAWRGLAGLLPLDIQLEVVPLPEGLDPADVLMGPDGAAAFGARVETGISWFDFIAECVGAKRSEGGRALALEVDRALELFQLLPRPVEIDAAIVDLAAKLDLPAATLRDQARAMKGTGARRNAARQQRGAAGSGARADGPHGPAGASERESSVTTAQKPQVAPMEPSIRRAYECLIAAAFLDASLIPRLRPWIARLTTGSATARFSGGNRTPGSGEIPGDAGPPEKASGSRDPGTSVRAVLGHIFQTLIDLYDHEDADITPALLMTHLAGHPASDHVARIADLGWTADNPQHLFQGAVEFLKQREQQAEIRRLQSDIQKLEALSASDSSAAAALENALMRLIELRRDSPA
ncbi:DNA primase [Planctomycetes bacterium Poly30]|uniref:DNA primase n=1 Tax=Saltatorellus ferox TaxID=2528018 RepID=A0A518ERW8_9BACT|nr:DNA primase [Planctomycetes bacterium Poly30]